MRGAESLIAISGVIAVIPATMREAVEGATARARARSLIPMSRSSIIIISPVNNVASNGTTKIGLKASNSAGSLIFSIRDLVV